LELGEVLRASKGSGADETAQAFARAVELCYEVGDRRRLGPALTGLWSSHLLRAKYSEARALADELSALVGADPNPVLGAFAARAVGMTAVHVGDFQAARTHLEHGLTLFSAEEHHHLEALREYGANPRVSCLAYLGRALWSLGYPDQALARNEEAVEEARARGSAFDVTVALSMLTTVRQLRGELAEMREATKAALEHARERGVTYWLVRNGLLREWVAAVTAGGAGETDRGVRRQPRALPANGHNARDLVASWAPRADARRRRPAPRGAARARRSARPRREHGGVLRRGGTSLPPGRAHPPGRRH